MTVSSPFVLIGMAGLAFAMATVVRSRPARDRIDPTLCDAASRGRVAGVKKLLASGVSADSADEDGMTALMAAAFAGEVEVVELLLERGADPDLQDESGLTALMNAVVAEGEMDLDGSHPVFLRIVEILLDAGADPGLEDENGLTAGSYASSYGLSEYADLLGDPGKPDSEDG